MEKYEVPVSGGAAVAADELLAKLCENYYAIYLLDLPGDRIRPLKLSYEAGAAGASAAAPWGKYLERMICAAVTEEHRDRVRDFLSKQRLKRAFNSLFDSAELVYRQSWGNWKKAVLQPIGLRGGETQTALLTLTDITETQRQYEALASENRRILERAEHYARLFFSATADVYAGMLKVDLESGTAYRLEFSNGGIQEVLLPRPWETVCRRFLERVHPDDRPEVARRLTAEFFSALHDGERVAFSYRSRDKNAAYRWYSSALRLTAERGRGRAATIFTVDIDDDMSERARLKDASEHDALTDLFNRTKLEEMVAGEYGSLACCGVLFFDVNGLKCANDTLGHDAGDALLCRMADSLRSVTSRRVHGYRYGGDEFLLVVCDPRKGELECLVQMWLARLDVLNRAGGVKCTAAVGQAVGTRPVGVEGLIRAADAAMYRNKLLMKRKR